MLRTIWTLLAASTIVNAAPVWGQTIETGDIKLKLLGRVQTQFSTTSVDEAELVAAGRAPASPIAASMFETRRIRFGAEVEYQKWLTGKIETELAMARLQIRDAFVNLGFDPRFNFRVGQFKKPFSMLQLYSSTTYPMIERGVRIRGLAESLAYRDSLAGGARVLQNFRGATVLGEEQELLETFLYQNYDLGAAVHGRFGSFGYTAGAFNGTGSDRPDDNDSKSLAARITYRLPFELPVTLGAAISHREFRIATTPAIRTRDGTAYEMDLEVGAFRRPGAHFLGEVAFGDNMQDTTQTFVGVQGMLAWFAPIEGGRVEGIEFGGRVSYGDPRGDVNDDEGILLTPGINVYFSGRNRLMLNWDFFEVSDRFDNENALRAQAQIYF
jgi:hypothetical protein